MCHGSVPCPCFKEDLQGTVAVTCANLELLYLYFLLMCPTGRGIMLEMRTYGVIEGAAWQRTLQIFAMNASSLGPSSMDIQSLPPTTCSDGTQI